jgi:septal ring factor EnvC (AmiA/AmiB activator)
VTKLTRRRRIPFLIAALTAFLLTAAPALADLGDRQLRTGLEGTDVRELQTLLAQLGYTQPVTGYYGPLTAAAVRVWERQAGERADGVVDPDQAKRMRRWAEQRLKANGGTTPSAPPEVDRPQTGPTAPIPIPSVPVSSSGYVFPVRGPHSFGTAINRFGAPRGGRSHQGHDVMSPAGTPIVAARGGRVSHRASGGGAGNYVVIQADDGNDHVYMHLREPAIVGVGQTVRAGQAIGRVGCTGSCSGDHLHFELWVGRWYRGGHPADPLANLRAWDAAS